MKAKQRLLKKMEAMALIDGWDLNPAEVTGWLEPEIWASKGGDLEFRCSMPDYLTDNEIDRMVRGLDGKYLGRYVCELYSVIAPDKPQIEYAEEVPAFVTATATPAQKVEAFLKANGEWK